MAPYFLNNLVLVNFMQQDDGKKGQISKDEEIQLIEETKTFQQKCRELDARISKDKETKMKLEC